jgi:hypothetical protein
VFGIDLKVDSPSMKGAFVSLGDLGDPVRRPHDQHVGESEAFGCYNQPGGIFIRWLKIDVVSLGHQQCPHLFRCPRGELIDVSPRPGTSLDLVSQVVITVSSGRPLAKP